MTAPTRSGAPRPQPTGRARGRVLLVGSAVLFGLAALFARVAAGAGMGGGQASLVRFTMGLAVMGALFRLRPGTFRPARWDLLAVRGLVGGVSALLYYLAIALSSAGEATLLNGLYPIFAVLLSLWVLGERPTVHLAVALAVASGGVYLVLCGGVDGGSRFSLHLGWGEALGILSGVAGGVAVTAIRALRAARVNAPTVFACFSAGGFLLSLPFGFAPWTSSPLAWGAALAGGVAALFAQLSMTEAYGALSIPEAAVLQQLTPIAAYLWGLLLLERLTWPTAMGVLLGLVGVVYGSLLGARPGARSPEAARVPVLPAEEP